MLPLENAITQEFAVAAAETVGNTEEIGSLLDYLGNQAIGFSEQAAEANLHETLDFEWTADVRAEADYDEDLPESYAPVGWDADLYGAWGSRLVRVIKEVNPEYYFEFVQVHVETLRQLGSTASSVMHWSAELILDGDEQEPDCAYEYAMLQLNDNERLENIVLLARALARSLDARK